MIPQTRNVSYQKKMAQFREDIVDVARKLKES